ncbi:STAS domain-containing protein [Magnetococcus sp. PR-3]|uniref:STAS domain-containing protein n=1 Tax=Magnetococcus sp. PR-3 TaxID=3120355 RepID=UPI002FCE4A70
MPLGAGSTSRELYKIDEKKTEIIYQDDYIVIKPPVQFNAQCHTLFFRAVEELTNATHFLDEIPNYRVDLTEVRQVDSAGMDMLLLLRQHLKHEDQSITLLLKHPEVKQQLSLAKFDLLFTLVEHTQAIHHDPVEPQDPPHFVTG